LKSLPSERWSPDAIAAGLRRSSCEAVRGRADGATSRAADHVHRVPPQRGIASYRGRVATRSRGDPPRTALLPAFESRHRRDFLCHGTINAPANNLADSRLNDQPETILTNQIGGDRCFGSTGPPAASSSGRSLIRARSAVRTSGEVLYEERVGDSAPCGREPVGLPSLQRSRRRDRRAESGPDRSSTRTVRRAPSRSVRPRVS